METGEVIFGKGNEQNPLELTTGNFTLGTGLKISVAEKLCILTSVNFNIADYDLLDVVHNYNEQGERLKILGIYPDFKIGLFYSITSYKAGEGRKKRYSIRPYNPYSPAGR